MPDAQTTEETVRLAFVKQASSCRGLGSPFTASLCTLAAERLTAAYPVGAKILSWSGDPSPSGDSVPLRLAGALVLSGSDAQLACVYPPHAAEAGDLWNAVEHACRTHGPLILDRLESAPQTNEVRRSAVLLPGFLTISSLFDKSLVLSEVGASAGLNLYWDHYDYRLGDMAWALQPSPVLIAPQWTGPAPPNVPVHIASRAGCDLNPLNPARDEDALRLLSYIWADQADRLERTRFALSIAASNRQTPNRQTVERADAVDWLALRLQPVHEDQVHVIYHTIAWQYLPRHSQEKGEALIAAAGARATERAPLARLEMEADDQKHSAALTLQIWPSGEKHLIGRADFHGRWIEWTGWPGLH